MTLSSSEAQWEILSEAVKEVVFMIQLLRNMNILVKLPVITRVENMGVILMATDIITMSCTKHMDFWYKYLNEYVGDRVVKIIFVVC